MRCLIEHLRVSLKSRTATAGYISINSPVSQSVGHFSQPEVLTTEAGNICYIGRREALLLHAARTCRCRRFRCACALCLPPNKAWRGVSRNVNEVLEECRGMQSASNVYL